METSNSLLDADIIREQKPVWAFSRKVFCEGIRDGVPIALGYFAVSFSLGIAARKAANCISTSWPGSRPTASCTSATTFPPKK